MCILKYIYLNWTKPSQNIISITLFANDLWLLKALLTLCIIRNYVHLIRVIVAVRFILWLLTRYILRKHFLLCLRHPCMTIVCLILLLRSDIRALLIRSVFILLNHSVVPLPFVLLCLLLCVRVPTYACGIH